LLLSACTTDNEKNTTRHEKQNVDESCRYYTGNLWATKITRTHIEGTLQRFKISADEVIKRPRQGKMMKFIDYEELYFKNLTIEQLLQTKIVSFDQHELNLLMPVDHQVHNNQATPALINQNEAKVLGHVLNRILGDDIKIIFKPVDIKKQPIVLMAHTAKILTDTMTIQFEGNMTLNAAHCKISSTMAIWSNIDNGIFFSKTFSLNNKTYQPPAFFQITDTGYCQKIPDIKNVDSIDKLDVIEYKMFESMPEPIRFLFGMVALPITQPRR
jgi:hypothetical protein